MLIDKIKEYNPKLTIDGCGENISDAIVFYIDEPEDVFAERSHKNGIITLPSFSPYSNIFLQLNDGSGFWYIERKKDGEYYLYATCFTPHCNMEEHCALQNHTPYYTKYRVTKLKQLEHHGTYRINTDVPILTDHPVFGFEDVESVEETREYSRGAAVMFAIMIKSFLDILSCKNIRSEQIGISIKKNNKRVKKGKLPLTSYYILQIQIAKTTMNNIHMDLWSNRVHLCRGHIKTYTADKPLFGKYVGNVWCPPHARGNKELGLINKDYKVN